MIHPTPFAVKLMTNAAGMPVGNGGKLDWKRLINQAGMRVPSIHQYLGSIEENLDAAICEAEDFRAKYITMTGMYRFDYFDENLVKQLAERLNKAGETLSKGGIMLLYHNHNIEFSRLKFGTTPYKILMEETDPQYVNFEFDSGLYDGEVYNAGIDTVHTGKPVKFTGTLPEDFVKRFCSVRIREEIPVKSVSESSGVTIIDFGQNFAGIITIDPSKMDGDSLKLRHGEILNQDGTLYTNNLRKAKAEIVYKKGNSSEKYVPRFTYMGFRYVELSGVPYKDGLLTAYAIYSDMERTGFFTCGNEKVQRLYENQVWGQKSNYVEVPTDCPQRDERMGYTGDGQVFALTGA